MKNNSTFQRFKRRPIDFIRLKLDELYYDARAFFFPYNVVKIKNISRTWNDRDYVMFHAMFQILVDFVELEQPFLDWEDKFKMKRHTDIPAMHRYIEENYGERAYSKWHDKWMSEEDKQHADIDTAERYKINTEILFLYSWYKAEKYNFKMVQPKLSKALAKMLDLPEEDDNLPRPSSEEYHAARQAHKAMCDEMLVRILNIRRNLWT